MNSVSLTQRANYVALVMVISRLLDLDLDQGQVTEIVTGVVAAVAVLTALYGRWRVGDLTILGFRKKN